MANKIIAFQAESQGNFRYDLEIRDVWLSTSVPSFGFSQIIRQKLRSIGLLAREAYFNSIFCQDHAIL